MHIGVDCIQNHRLRQGIGHAQHHIALRGIEGAGAVHTQCAALCDMTGRRRHIQITVDGAAAQGDAVAACQRHVVGIEVHRPGELVGQVRQAHIARTCIQDTGARHTQG